MERGAHSTCHATKKRLESIPRHSRIHFNLRVHNRNIDVARVMIRKAGAMNVYARIKKLCEVLYSTHFNDVN